MNILHSLIGLPHVRHGGAPAYAFDLLMAQAAIPNNRVTILIQGDTLYWGHKSKIRLNGQSNGINCFDISNPVTSPLMHGVKNPKYILEGRRHFDKKNLERFYEETTPDIFHVHTLMGLPIELLMYLKSKGTKLVLTSHDYYGICPRVNLKHSREFLSRHLQKLYVARKFIMARISMLDMAVILALFQRMGFIADIMFQWVIIPIWFYLAACIILLMV